MKKGFDINLDNYEAFLLDYMEGALSDGQVAKLKAFMMSTPALEAEWLEASEMDMDELGLRSEGLQVHDLDLTHKLPFEAELAQLEQEIHLVAPAVHFSDFKKRALLHATGWSWKRSLQTAASVLILVSISLPFLNQVEPNYTPLEREINAVKKNTVELQKAEAHAKKTPVKVKVQPQVKPATPIAVQKPTVPVELLQISPTPIQLSEPKMELAYRSPKPANSDVATPQQEESMSLAKYIYQKPDKLILFAKAFGNKLLADQNWIEVKDKKINLDLGAFKFRS